jgi:hypothetical protein
VHPHDTAPLIGASGAISGCMGAFAVAFARTPVRFALLLTFRPRIFTAPAYAVLPLWAAFEAILGWLLPDDGTATMAHVGGFAFGIVGALVLHWTGVDRRLDDSVERAAAPGGDPRRRSRRAPTCRRRSSKQRAQRGTTSERRRPGHERTGFAPRCDSGPPRRTAAFPGLGVPTASS